MLVNSINLGGKGRPDPYPNILTAATGETMAGNPRFRADSTQAARSLAALA
jgi:hypothetical protein